MKIVYQGPHADGVVIGATGQHAMPGEPVEVPKDVATQLLEQDTWAAHGTVASRRRSAATSGGDVPDNPAASGQKD